MTTPKKVTHFPHVVRAGSASVTVYKTPARRGNARYNAYTLVHHFAGKRVRRKFHDLAQALSAAKTTAGDIDQGRLGRRVLTAAETADYIAAEEALVGTGVGLIDAVREFAEAKRNLPEVHLVRAVQFFQRYAGDTLVEVTVPDAVKQFLAHKAAQGVGAYHQHDLKTRLEKFAEKFPCSLAEIASTEINGWLAALKVESRTQNNYRAAVVQLSWARPVRPTLRRCPRSPTTRCFTAALSPTPPAA